MASAAARKAGMTDQGRRTAAIVVGVVLAGFLFIVVSSLRAGDKAGRRSDADGAFIAGMVPHHGSAVEMAAIALGRSKRREVKRLAQDIINSQTAEAGTSVRSTSASSECRFQE